MYLVIDDYGTNQVAWTMKSAMDWLKYCSGHAVIANRFTLTVLRVRMQ